MKDVAIFLGGIIFKSIIGMIVGACLKQGVQSIKNERKLYIAKHYKDNHDEDIKYCQRDTCIDIV